MVLITIGNSAKRIPTAMGRPSNRKDYQYPAGFPAALQGLVRKVPVTKFPIGQNIRQVVDEVCTASFSYGAIQNNDTTLKLVDRLLE